MASFTKENLKQIIKMSKMHKFTLTIEILKHLNCRVLR